MPIEISHFAQVSEKDTAKILALVQEYAEKLRALCVAYAEARAKRQQVILMSATFMAIIMAASLLVVKFYFPVENFNSTFLTAMAGVIGASISLFPLLLVGSLARSRDLYDVHHVALTVERLLRTASQYSEHATHALGDKFEFDIRLAEAEASLHVYRSVFRDSAEKMDGSYRD